ncbi:MAG: iron ABC transporter permease, partial [Clostridiales bacterium]
MMTEQKSAAKWLILLLLPLLFAAVSFTIGKYSISLSQLLHTIFYHYVDPTQIADPKMETVLFNIRLPRVLAVLMVGGGLSMAGASYQGMFKNPLVSPDILGVSAGAGFGASLALLLSLPMAMVQVFAFCGGMLAVSLAVFVNRSMKYDPLLALILGGILVSTLFSSGISMVKFLADADDKLPAITFWLMGSFSSVNKHDLLPLFIPMGISYVILIGLRWKLN